MVRYEYTWSHPRRAITGITTVAVCMYSKMACKKFGHVAISFTKMSSMLGRPLGGRGGGRRGVVMRQPHFGLIKSLFLCCSTEDKMWDTFLLLGIRLT